MYNIPTNKIYTIQIIRTFSVFYPAYYPSRYVIKIELHVTSTTDVKYNMTSKHRSVISRLHTRRYFRLLLFAREI